MKRWRDESGQVFIIAALAQVVFVVVVGFAVDYGFWLLERQKLQNAVDAASLAGARALVDGATPGVTAARATTLDYLDRHGYRADADTAVAVTFPTGAGGLIESVAVDVQRTRDKPLLLRIADNVAGVSCPAGQSPYACPLKSWRYENPTIATGSVAGPAQPAGTMLTSNAGASEVCIGGDCDLRPDFTGTKLPNGVTVVANSWSTAAGGRNDPAVGVARKVLVMITDGQNELWPSTGHPVGNASVWDAEAVTAANTLKRGLDGITGTADDVEIYTIGFVCEAGSLTGWCQSSLVNQYDAPRPCPGGALPAQRSTVDNILIQMSTSAPGACDRYFPIAKGENLPQLFQTIAGAITRSRLTQ